MYNCLLLIFKIITSQNMINNVLSIKWNKINTILPSESKERGTMLLLYTHGNLFLPALYLCSLFYYYNAMNCGSSNTWNKVCSIANLWKLCMKRSKNEKKKLESLQGFANVTVSRRGPVLNTCRGLRVCESGRALLVSAFREDYRDFIFSHFHICLCDQLLVDVA